MCVINVDFLCQSCVEFAVSYVFVAPITISAIVTQITLTNTRMVVCANVAASKIYRVTQQKFYITRSVFVRFVYAIMWEMMNVCKCACERTQALGNKCHSLLKNSEPQTGTEHSHSNNFTCINNGTNFKLIISMCYVSRLTK